ncbi:MAG: hypothetical protein O9282_11150 [Flavobacterium sp.]|jgi:hypothetical protein|uniref:hypothetical protein n=1 Tax=Flavobacterium sp. TaxID=239 RepID=UPI0022BBA496|nr:hypothetical protein [Flavobacterium sp.]MCZ8089198.1 hypothetical protein [Flavobacterium sp.]MCZ8331856.1 hypothetical protein [Flavobacterium sp.]
MKKLFFSAVALIAFSSVSMGNTIELKENLDELKPAESVKRTSHAICENARVHYYNHLSSQGVPHDEASGRAYGIYFQCMGRALSVQ